MVLGGTDAEATLIFEAYTNSVGLLSSARGYTSVDFDVLDLSANNLTVKHFTVMISQGLFLAAKAETNPNKAVAYCARKVSMLLDSGSIDGRALMGPELAAEMCQVISSSYNLHSGMVHLIMECKRVRTTGGQIASAINQGAQFIWNTGMTGIDLVTHYLVLTRSPVLELNALSTEILTVLRLLELYKAKGAEAPFLRFINTTDPIGYSPSTYLNLYATALGIASALELTINMGPLPICLCPGFSAWGWK